jgi:hypothetical protein
MFLKFSFCDFFIGCFPLELLTLINVHFKALKDFHAKSSLSSSTSLENSFHHSTMSCGDLSSRLITQNPFLIDLKEISSFILLHGHIRPMFAYGIAQPPKVVFPNIHSFYSHLFDRILYSIFDKMELKANIWFCQKIHHSRGEP